MIEGKGEETMGYIDRQCVTPVGRCPWCGRELYPGEEARLLGGRPVHEVCLEEYVDETFPRTILDG